MHKKFITYSIAGLLTCISISSQAELNNQKNSVKKTNVTYKNPVYDIDFPDPTVIKALDGYFYAYATQTIIDGKTINIQAARSKNMINWESIKDVLPVKPSWANQTQKFWAPHVSQWNNKYYMYYSADPNTLKGLCLGVATSDKPEGPFVDSGKPLQCGESFINIDPMAFVDPKTKKKLLYWGSGFQPIKVKELADNGISFKDNSKPIDLVKPIEGKTYQKLVEGAWVIYRNGYYYLFYSGDNCCGDNAHYAVMVARSKNATGPFETYAKAHKKTESTILERKDYWIAPGHNSIITDDAGQDWMFYHAINPQKRKTAMIAGDRDVRRIMLMDRVTYVNGWPQIENMSPSVSTKAGPVIKNK